MKKQIPLALIVFSIAIQPALHAGDALNPQQIVKKAIKAIAGKNVEKLQRTIVEDEGLFFGFGEGSPYKGRYVFDYSNGQKRTRFEIVGVFTSVTDGDNAWVSAMGQVMDVKGETLKIAKRKAEADFAFTLIPLQKPNKKYKLSLAKPQEIDGEACEGIVVSSDVMPTITMWFSTKTWLMKKTHMKSKDPEQGFKEVTDETIYHSFKKFDGIQTPSKMTIFRDGKKFVESTPKNVTYPASIDDKEFKKPE